MLKKIVKAIACNKKVITIEMLLSTLSFQEYCPAPLNKPNDVTVIAHNVPESVSTYQLTYYQLLRKIKLCETKQVFTQDLKDFLSKPPEPIWV